MLAKELKSLAEMYALKAIDLEDVEYLSGLTKENLPEDFFKYAELYGLAYDAYCLEQQALAEAKKLIQQEGSDFDIDKQSCMVKSICFLCKLG